MGDSQPTSSRIYESSKQEEGSEERSVNPARTLCESSKNFEMGWEEREGCGGGRRVVVGWRFCLFAFLFFSLLCVCVCVCVCLSLSLVLLLLENINSVFCMCCC